MNSMEEKLWGYIDGTLPDAELRQIERSLHTNVEIKQQYEELLALHIEFYTLELDEPPMAFTYNVMEQIRTEEALVPLSSKADKRLIYAVAGFFILTIGSLLAFAISSLNWSDAFNSSTSSVGRLPVNITITNNSGSFGSNWLQYFVCFDIVLALVLGDAYLRKRARMAINEKINVQ